MPVACLSRRKLELNRFATHGRQRAPRAVLDAVQFVRKLEVVRELFTYTHRECTA